MHATFQTIHCHLFTKNTDCHSVTMINLQQRIYLVKSYGIGDVSYRYEIGLFNHKYTDVHITVNGIKKLIKKFDETESVEVKEREKGIP